MGVPLFLILHIGFVHYFVSCGNANSEQGRKPTDQRHLRSQYHSLGRRQAQSIILIIVLFGLRLLAVHFLLQLVKRLDAVGATFWNDHNLHSIILPITIVLVDNTASIGFASEGHVYTSWTSLIQSALWTYFFLRPLAALGGFDVDPAGGRIGLGIMMILGAIWIYTPSISGKLYDLSRR